MARELEAMGCDSRSPSRTWPACSRRTSRPNWSRRCPRRSSVPLALHSHTTVGMADMCMLQGDRERRRPHGHRDLVASPGAPATRRPRAWWWRCRARPYDTGLDLELLQEIGFYFREVRKKYHQFESEFTGIDTRVHDQPGAGRHDLQPVEPAARNRAR